jgi:hypothetical protein
LGRHAARALARLARDNLPIQSEVCKFNGVALLLALLSSKSIEVQIQAANALSELCQVRAPPRHRLTGERRHAGTTARGSTTRLQLRATAHGISVNA